MPRRKTSKPQSIESLKTQLLAVKLRAEQVKLRVLEWNTTSRALGSLTPLPDDTLAHLRVPLQLDLERNPQDRKKLDYARRIGLAPPGEEMAEDMKVETNPETPPAYVPQPPHPNEATDPEYKALMDRVRKVLADPYEG